MLKPTHQKKKKKKMKKKKALEEQIKCLGLSFSDALQ